MRAKRIETGNTDFLATAELVPAGTRPYNCGARNISLTSFRPTGDAAHFHARSLPDNEFTAALPLKLTNDYWHTYGVEVTRKRISWFVDGEVRRTERRPAARSGVKLDLRLGADRRHGRDHEREPAAGRHRPLLHAEESRSTSP